MSEPKRVLIAGCGDVGGKLASMLVEDGYRVWGLRRSVKLLPEKVLPLRADMAANDFSEPLPRDLDLVFYTAAAAGDRSEDGYRRAYIDGLVHILNRLRRGGTKPRRFFFTSSTSVYGQTDGSRVDETSPTVPARFTGRVMLEAEKTLLGSGFPATVVRLSGIYGPGRTRLRDMAAKGISVQDPDRYTNRIHRDDCAGLLRHLAAMKSPEPVYIGTDDEPAPYFEVLSWLAEQMNAPAPAIAEERTGNLGKRCSNQKIRETGFRCRYPSYKNGYPDLIRTSH